MPHPAVSKDLKELSKRNLEQRRAMAGIGPRRAEIIVAGAMVFAELMDKCGAATFRYLPLGSARRPAGADDGRLQRQFRP